MSKNQCGNPSYYISQNFLTSRRTIDKLIAKADLTSDDTVIEIGAAKRFCGIPSENLNSLSLKPFFDLKIIWYFNRNDFHPSPRADVVMLEMKPKKPADIPFIYRNTFRMFLTKGSKNGVYGSKGILTKKQVSTALRLAKLPMIPPSGKMSYAQWLCLFRYILSLNSTMRR